MNMHIFIFFELKYMKSLTVLNYQGRYGKTLLLWGKTVKCCAQVARNLIIFSNIHLCFIYFKHTTIELSESSLRYKRCKLRCQAEDNQLFILE